MYAPLQSMGSALQSRAKEDINWYITQSGKELPKGVKMGAPHGNVVIGVVVSFAVLSLLVILLRIYIRGIMVKNLGLDDGFIVFAMVGAIATTVTVVLQATTGSPLGIIGLNATVLKVTFASSICYWTTAWAIKMSILCFCLSIFGSVSRARMLTLGCMVFITAHHITAIFTNIFQCNPIQRAWDPKNILRGCIDVTTSILVHACIGLVTDVIVYTLPVYLLSKTQINSKKKVFVIAIFALGGVSIVGSIGRLASIVILTKHRGEVDKWIMNPIFTSVELDIGIIASSLPALSPLIKSTWRNVQTRTQSRFRGSKYSNNLSKQKNGYIGYAGTAGSHQVDPMAKGILVDQSYAIKYDETSSHDSNEAQHYNGSNPFHRNDGIEKPRQVVLSPPKEENQGQIELMQINRNQTRWHE